VIGIVLDGTGLGPDGNIWGGEFFIGNIKSFKRAAHLKYIPMPGGELSVREPWRMALSYLYNINAAFPRRWDKGKIELIIQAIDKDINSPLTSSMGRLFDAVSSLAGICEIARYEAQPAIELEKAIIGDSPRRPDRDRYNFSYKDKDGVIEIDWRPLLRGVVNDLKARKDKREISLRFHNAICYMIKDICNLLRKKYGISRVCMSGGVFQNRYLTSNAPGILEKEGFGVYLHKNIPAHDGNIALGQAVIAATR
jgi:hydrogenase maturation protein HypF